MYEPEAYGEGTDTGHDGKYHYWKSPSRVSMPAQGLYDLVIWDASAEDLKQMFKRECVGSEQEVIKTIERCLAWINDRFRDGSHIEESDAHEVPKTEDLIEKKKALKEALEYQQEQLLG